MAAIRHGGRVTVAPDNYSVVRPVCIHAGHTSIGLQTDEAARLAKELIQRLADLDHQAAVQVLIDCANIVTD